MRNSVSLMGLDRSADSQFHLSSWLDVSGETALPTLPTIERLRGTDQTDSACPGLPPGSVAQVVLPGCRHFDGKAAVLGTSTLAGLK